MFRVFQEEKLITICMFAFLVSSILLRVFLGLLYRNMIKEADNMASTRNRLLKQCKTKFASCYQLGNGVANIPVFVDKFLNRMTLGRLSFETIYHLSGQLMLLSVVFSGIGICKSIIGGRTVGEVLPFYIVSFFGLYVYFSVSTVVDVRGKKRMLKINLVDYLENHLSPRIEVTRQDMEMLYGEASFEEKQLSRITGGRKERARNRKGRRGVQEKPEKKCTVELMPIENRMAVGGDMIRGGSRAEQAYPARQQAMRAGGSQQMWQMPQAEDGQQNGWSRAEAASRTEQGRGVPEQSWAETGQRTAEAMQMEQGQQTLDRPWAEQGQRTPDGLWAEQGQRTLDGPWAEQGQRTLDGPWAEQGQRTLDGAQVEQGQRTLNESWAEQGQRTLDGARAEQGQRTLDEPWAEQGQRTQDEPWAEQGQRTLDGARAEQGQQAARTAPGQPNAPEFRTGGESPEDSAAVTEEELEALLKEFLAT